jgi:type II secretory pathway pseudopilin PulG
MTPRGSRGGFSLLEVLVAGAMFAVGTTGVLSAWSSINGIVDTQRRSADAIIVAEDVLDELRLQQRTGPGLTIDGHQRFFTRDRENAASPTIDGYIVEWEVAQVGAFSYRKVDLTVRWNGVDRRQHRLAFLTFRPG